MNIQELKIEHAQNHAFSRILRGGSLLNDSNYVHAVRHAIYDPGISVYSNGFRFVLRTLHEH
jgi:hypothetical protein